MSFLWASSLATNCQTPRLRMRPTSHLRFRLLDNGPSLISSSFISSVICTLRALFLEVGIYALYALLERVLLTQYPKSKACSKIGRVRVDHGYTMRNLLKVLIVAVAMGPPWSSCRRLEASLASTAANSWRLEDRNTTRGPSDPPGPGWQRPLRSRKGQSPLPRPR